MAKAKRNIGVEILEGLREIKRGDYGRVINIPDIVSIRESEPDKGSYNHRPDPVPPCTGDLARVDSLQAIRK